MKTNGLFKKIRAIDVVLLFSGLIGFAIIIFMWQADVTVAKKLTREDGLIESLSALFYLLGFIICIYYLVKRRSMKNSFF